MIRRFVTLASILSAFAAPAFATDAPEIPALPSGLSIDLQEVLFEDKPDGMNVYARFRFVAPDIASVAPDYETRLTDMQLLCDRYALRTLTAESRAADIIVISLADRPTDFGKANPEATQFFEAFRIKPSLSGGLCIVEDF